MDGADVYPPAPPNVPPDLATPTTSYRLRVMVVLASLLLFAVLYLGLVVGSAYMCYRSFAALAPADPLQATRLGLLGEVSRVEDRVGGVYNDALRQFRGGQMGGDQFLQVLERDVLPPWRAERQRLVQASDLSGEEQRIVDRYQQSMHLQEESWVLLGRAIRNQDADAAEQARQKAQQADDLGRQVGADVGRYVGSQAPRNRDSTGRAVIVGIPSGLFCLFLVKGFFKWRRAAPAQRLEVNEADQPALFAFIRRLCRDARAPLPHRVYLTPEVNAAVFYHESLLSLFLPTPKNLVIGLGLVNQLNLSEFKAVLAHEFGHFSQTSMKLGSYVYVSNRVIADVVFGRDWLDDLVAGLRRTDVRIAVFAWAFTGGLWALRKALQGLFTMINFANSSLSRQMEFNADLVAVSLTGSDALIHGLARLDLASAALVQAGRDVTAAADRRLFTRDLFYHQARAVDYLRAQKNDPRLGEPPALPDDPNQTVQVFPPEDTSVPKMWATHPTNHDREMNAKRRYVRSPIDGRSPWLLFQSASAVRETITLRLYQAAGHAEGLVLEAPDVVQAFIDEEHAETTYDRRYHGLYDDRYVTPGELDDLVRSTPAEFAAVDRLTDANARLYGDELKVRMEAHRARQDDYRRLAALAHGAAKPTGPDFQFRGARHRAADAGKLLEQVKKELDEDSAWMAHLDRQTFLVHYEMARQLSDDARRELDERYRFHLAVQEYHRQLSAHRMQVQLTLTHLAGKRELSQGEFQVALEVLGQAHDELSRLLGAAGGLGLPRLKNVTPGEPLGALLLSGPLIARLDGASNSLDGAWIGQFRDQVAEVLDKMQRLHFKSLGGILALQERLAEQWSEFVRRRPEEAGVGGFNEAAQ